MIQDLQHRAEFWAEHHRVPCQGDSIARPFVHVPGWRGLVTGRSVLEIGPGEGRQFAELRPLAASYAIADIVPKVLENVMYRHAGRHLITSYHADEFGERFDVICFWYVLHHVLRDEGSAFFEFIERHLAEGGDVIFNTPSASQSVGVTQDGGNGTETTPWQPDEVEALLHRVGLGIVHRAELAHNCLVIHARRG
ncbi:MAG: methyltransferase domain-containing protein [Phycisphaerales bacterium]|nr:methyltransferase domain-containing protein [Phycisphaerales bacterium]